MTMNELHLFAGAGGGILGGMLLGHTCVCAVEIEPYCRKILLQRQRDGILPHFPIWDDIRTFDGRPWKGLVDVVAGGFPCQDISCADNINERRGLDGTRSELWTEFRRVVCEVHPCFVFVENTPMLTFRGLGRILGELVQMGYDAKWGVFSASDVGAWHVRERIWILAHPKGERMGKGGTENIGNGQAFSMPAGNFPSRNWKENASRICRMDYGMASQIHRGRAIGNGQFPAVVRLAWNTLMDEL
jgi:DNA (cytosine-5)-methyltransferase 1